MKEGNGAFEGDRLCALIPEREVENIVEDIGKGLYHEVNK